MGLRLVSGRHSSQDDPVWQFRGKLVWCLGGDVARDFDLPSVMMPGLQAWTREGELHRRNKPAYIEPTMRLYCWHGRIHRDDGPALELPTVAYYYHHGLLLGSDRPSLYRAPAFGCAPLDLRATRHVVLLSGWSVTGRRAVAQALRDRHGFQVFAFRDTTVPLSVPRMCGVCRLRVNKPAGDDCIAPRQAVLECPYHSDEYVSRAIRDGKAPCSVVVDWQLPQQVPSLRFELAQAMLQSCPTAVGDTQSLVQYKLHLVRVRRRGQPASPVLDFASEHVLQCPTLHIELDPLPLNVAADFAASEKWSPSLPPVSDSDPRIATAPDVFAAADSILRFMSRDGRARTMRVTFP